VKFNELFVKYYIMVVKIKL